MDKFTHLYQRTCVGVSESFHQLRLQLAPELYTDSSHHICIVFPVYLR